MVSDIKLRESRTIEKRWAATRATNERQQFSNLLLPLLLNFEDLGQVQPLGFEVSATPIIVK
jgi:hypothetical protein